MNISSKPFSELPFSKLFQDYVTAAHSIRPFYRAHPFIKADTEHALNNFQFKGNRKASAAFLRSFNQQFGAGKAVFDSIDKLEKPEALAVVTGQQLTIYGGPLFTVYKILTTIIFARRWQELSGRPVVPVFWLADEDHDYDEAASLGVFDKDEVKHFFYDQKPGISPRVAEITLDDRISAFRDSIQNSLFDTDFSDILWKELDRCYKPGATFGEAFGSFLITLFGEYGLVLAGSRPDEAKRLVKQPMVDSVTHAGEIYQQLKETSERLESSGYHSQVHLQPSNLFFIEENGNRVKIHFENDKWYTDNGSETWTNGELETRINHEPERFSPNVFLRPLTQNYLLPSAAYVAGPGEIAYYAQTSGLYSTLGMQMPLIVPRYSATLIETGVDRVLKKLPFKPADYIRRIEDLEAEYIKHADTPDIERIFRTWNERVQHCSEDGIKDVSTIDSTLESSAEKVLASFGNELDRLKGKVYRSVKEQEKVQLNRIERIQKQLFPNGNFQEREIAFIYFMNKYGPGIWDKLVVELQNTEPDSHKWINLV